MLGASVAFANPADSTPAATDRSSMAYDPQRHDALILAHRGGHVAPARALQQLKDWLDVPLSDSVRQRLVSDAVVMATAGGQFAEAVTLGRQQTPAGLSDYALEALAVAARRVQDTALQGDTISIWRARQPQALGPRIHEAFWRLDSGDVVGAKTISEALMRKAAEHIEVRVALLELRAAVARAEDQPLIAMAAYAEAGALRPERLDIRREADFLLADNGAAPTAFDDAEAAAGKNPGAFSALALSMLQQKALAQRLRWALQERDQRRGVARVVALDKVLAGQEAALVRLEAAAQQAHGADAEAWRVLRRNLESDRLLALVERGRPGDAVALYETLSLAGIDLPFHGLAAAARAFAQERRSAEAVPLYEAAIAKGGADVPMPGEIHFGLVYAYLDTGRFEQAEALLKRLEESTPALTRLAPEPGRPNSQYTEVIGMRALMQLYTDRLALAQQSFTALTLDAPLNAGYALGASLTERLRERPEAGLARLEAQMADHPDDIGMRVGHVEALLGAGWFGEARQRAASLVADVPDSLQVRDMERKRDTLTGARLEVDAAASRGGAVIASGEWRIDSRLSSGLIADQWRVFYDQSLAQGSTEAGNAKRVRGGLGLRWQRGPWVAEGALQHAAAGPYRNGMAGRVDYRASDAWRLWAAYDGDSKELPWKARVAGTGAREMAGGVGHVVNEARRFNLQWQRLDFSDGNVRSGLGLGWTERWVSTPRVQAETRLEAGTGRGRVLDTPYFNPPRDASVRLAARAQWLTWKSDDRQFFQAIEVGGGNYHQRGFGSGPLWSLRYEHSWSLGQRLTLRYGLGIASHPYDGVRERQRSVFLNFSMPLQ